MPYASNNGVKIYYEVEGEGPPLVLAHGGGRDLEPWRGYGYVEALRDDFQLILFDMRGHGRSDKLHEPSGYSVRLWADDVLAVLDDIGIGKAHYFGFSLSARVGFQLATHHAARFNSFILLSISPYDIPEVSVKGFKALIEGLQLLLTDADAYLLRQERRLGRSLTSEEKTRLLSQDAETLVRLSEAWLDSPPLSDEDLAGILAPCLVLCGELDENGFYSDAMESVKRIPNAEFVSLPGLNHPQAWARSDMTLPRVKEFLARVSKT